MECPAKPPGPREHSGLARQLLAVPEVGESLALGGGSTLKQKVCDSEVPPLSSIPSTILEQEGVRVAPRHPLTSLPPGPLAAWLAQTRSSGISHRHIPAYLGLRSGEP